MGNSADGQAAQRAPTTPTRSGTGSAFFDTKAVAEVAPERDAHLRAGFHRAEESGAAVASDVGTRSNAHLEIRHKAVDMLCQQDNL